MSRRPSCWIVAALLALSATGSHGIEGPAAEAEADEVQGDPSSVIRALRLPEWLPDDVREFDVNERPINLGGGLWPEELFPLGEVPARLPPTPLSEEAMKAQALGPSVPELLPAAIRPAYFEELPSRYLVDPQNLVDAAYAANVERFLRYHAENSALDTYVLVFRESQEVPADVSTGDLWKRWFGQGPGAILFFHLNRPEFSALEVGRQFARQAGRQRLQSILDSCVRDALTVGDSSAQLERFLVEYSTQLHRMQRTLSGEAIPEEEAIAGEDSSLTVDLASRDEFPAPAGRDGDALAGSGGVERVTARALPWSIVRWMASVVAFLVAAGAGIWLMASLRRYRLPEIEVPSRLGGGSTGGTDVVVSFTGRPSDGLAGEEEIR